MLLGNTPKALTLAAFGARGTGKTAWVKQTIAHLKPSRLIVWDFKNDPALEGVGVSIKSLPAMIAGMKGAAWAWRYQVDHGRPIVPQFELFCQAAYLAGNLTMFVDELPEVTKANKAPPAWRRCVNVGRLYRGADGKERSISIIGAGQRPNECDKSFISNADLIHTGRLSHLNDAKELAQSLGCPWRDLLALPDLHWIEREAGEIEPARGILTFSQKKISPKPKKGNTPKGHA
jgi:hypothetical protein